MPERARESWRRALTASHLTVVLAEASHQIVGVPPPAVTLASSPLLVLRVDRRDRAGGTAGQGRDGDPEQDDFEAVHSQHPTPEALVRSSRGGVRSKATRLNGGPEDVHAVRTSCLLQGPRRW